MKIAFVQSENENLALELFSAMLKEKGHLVELFYDHRYFARSAITLPGLARFFDQRDNLARAIGEGSFDLVCFSVMTSSYRWAVDMAERIKKLRSVPVLFGGVHAMSVPEVVIAEPSVDAVCIGEGEISLLELVGAFDSFPDVDVPGIWTKPGGEIRRREAADLVEDLDSLPFPDKALFYEKLPWLSHGYVAMTGRGCPFTCTFCSNEPIRKSMKGRGRYMRRRSVESIIAELEWAVEAFQPDRFNILDDCFTVDKKWLSDFHDLYKDRIGRPFVALSHPQLMDDEVAYLLKDAGCSQLLLGIQSSSEQVRRDVLNRRETNEQVREAALSCRRLGLSFSLDHIFGLPKTGVEDYRHALAFYNELRPAVINTYWLVYFPKTSIIDHAVEDGLLVPEDIATIERGEMDQSVTGGIGRELGPASTYSNYALLYSLVPLLPKRAIDFVIEHRLYLDNFSPPLWLTIAFRVLAISRLVWREYYKESFEIVAGFARFSRRRLSAGLASRLKGRVPS